MDGMFIYQLFTGHYWEYFSHVGIVMFSICLHEYGHAAMAFKLGDDTAARDGHLSLNPMIQLGPSSIFFLLFVGLAWGMVPVDPSVLRRHKFGEILVAFAGPAMNLILFFISGIVTAVLLLTGSEAERVIIFFWQVSNLNAALFILNMLPIPALDGWHIYEQWVPSMRQLDPEFAKQIAFFAILAILVTPIGNVIWVGADVMSNSVIKSIAVVWSVFT